MVVGIFEASFATLDFVPRLHTHDENIAFFRRAISEGECWLAGGGFALLEGDRLTHLYVHPDSIGRGIGHALFEHACRQRPNGFDFWVFQQNDRARRFYEKRGCTVLELTDGSRNEERTPDALYQWRPAAPGSSAR